MGAETEKTDFEFALGRPISLAQNLANIALDPEVQGNIEGEYPPTLTPRDFVNQTFVRSDVTLGGPDNERELAVIYQERLASWAAEGFFEVVPMPNRKTDNIGFKMSTKGAHAAVESLKSRRSAAQSLIAKATAFVGSE